MMKHIFGLQEWEEKFDGSSLSLCCKQQLHISEMTAQPDMKNQTLRSNIFQPRPNSFSGLPSWERGWAKTTATKPPTAQPIIGNNYENVRECMHYDFFVHWSLVKHLLHWSNVSEAHERIIWVINTCAEECGVRWLAHRACFNETIFKWSRG